MKIIVTGADGFVGKNLVEELLREGHRVVALVRSIRENMWFDERKIPFVVCSLSEYKDMDISKEMENADVFFHLAWDGTSGPKRGDLEIQTKNVLASRDAVYLARRCGCRRFVFAGSIMEYEAIEYVNMDDSSPSPSYIYSCQKLAGDQVTKIESLKTGMEYIALIISNIFGPGDNSPRFINTIVKHMAQDESIALTQGFQKYDFIYVADAVRAICLAGLRGRSRCSYYIGNSEQRSLREYVEAAKECMGSHSRLDFGVVPYCGVLSAYQRIDTEKLEREFQFTPEISFQEGIKKLLAYEEEML